MTTDNSYKEVNFDTYCKTCKYEELKESYDPCNECLDTGAREGTDKPTKWEEKE